MNPAPDERDRIRAAMGRILHGRPDAPTAPDHRRPRPSKPAYHATRSLSAIPT